MMKFGDRYWLRLAINFGCFAFILTSETGERAFIAVAFMVGLAVEPWIRDFEKRREGMKTQMDAMTEAARVEQAQTNFNRQ